MGRLPKREYLSPVRMNISRIDSARESRNYNYWLLGRRPQNRENPSLVQLNISRINSEGKNRIYIYHLLGRIPKRERKFVTG